MNDSLLNAGLEIAAALSLVLLAAFLIAGIAAPFLPAKRKARR